MGGTEAERRRDKKGAGGQVRQRDMRPVSHYGSLSPFFMPPGLDHNLKAPQAKPRDRREHWETAVSQGTNTEEGGRGGCPHH